MPMDVSNHSRTKEIPASSKPENAGFLGFDPEVVWILRKFHAVGPWISECRTDRRRPGRTSSGRCCRPSRIGRERGSDFRHGSVQPGTVSLLWLVHKGSSPHFLLVKPLVSIGCVTWYLCGVAICRVVLFDHWRGSLVVGTACWYCLM